MWRRGGSVYTVALRASMSGSMGLSTSAQLRFVVHRPDVRNIAVIAHVDHGKTTLVDGLLKFSGTMENARGRVMDSNDQEKERGITILAKNTAIVFNDGRRVNVVDTPGHLDFSGEVERVLQQVEGFILLVDAAEGVKPGTRYVLRKALTLKLHPIVCINKIDKEDQTIDKVVEQIQELFLETATDADQLDIHFLYGSGRDGYFNYEPVKGGTLDPLFQSVFEKIPAPKQDKEVEPFQMLVSLVDEEKDGMKIAIGRIFRGSINVGDVVAVSLGEQQERGLVKSIKMYRGVAREEVQTAKFGDVVLVTLQAPMATTLPLKIGASLCDANDVHPWPYHKPDPPTFTMQLVKTDAPWAGKEGPGGTPQKMAELRTRLTREVLINTALQIDGLDSDKMTLMGRGPLHLSVLIESLRREGFEFELRAPSVIKKEIDGQVCEPWERLSLEFPRANSSEVVSMISMKFGEVQQMTNTSDDRIMLEALMPVRLMTDLSTQFNRMTGGRGVLNHVLDGYRPEAPVESERASGALVSIEDGTAQLYSLAGLAGNGRFFVEPGDSVYFGQIVGENGKVLGQDVPVNVTKKNEQLGGMRANALEKANRRGTNYDFLKMGLEDFMSWINPSELITVTPKSVRMRKPGFNGKTTQRNSTKKQ